MAVIIDMRPECATKPTILDVAQFGGIMLWPHDPEAQLRYVKAAVASTLNKQRFLLSLTTLRGLSDLQSQAMPMQELFEEMREPFTYGMAAGSVLRQMVGASASKGRVAHKGKAIDWYLANVASKNQSSQSERYVKLAPQTIHNTVWPRYRGVAHFWAAEYLQQERNGEPDWPWPCHPSGLLTFISIAEEFRKLGESLRTKQGPILNPADSVRPPDWLTLPAVEFAIE